MPDPRKLAAVIRGVLFLGTVDDPASFEQIATMAVMKRNRIFRGFPVSFRI
ncbi:hypothetical protein [Propionibacterium acidifaciens]|uniref:hypothetical protein n=1 Tax=Propionibacterium acidifaciens TaxID=556499 RepID=UPI0028E6B3AC|nr:hypothetical protein [Propionibacterium acidifaciens]